MNTFLDILDKYNISPKTSTGTKGSKYKMKSFNLPHGKQVTNEISFSKGKFMPTFETSTKWNLPFGAKRKRSFNSKGDISESIEIGSLPQDGVGTTTSYKGKANILKPLLGMGSFSEVLSFSSKRKIGSKRFNIGTEIGVSANGIDFDLDTEIDWSKATPLEITSYILIKQITQIMPKMHIPFGISNEQQNQEKENPLEEAFPYQEGFMEEQEEEIKEIYGLSYAEPKNPSLIKTEIFDNEYDVKNMIERKQEQWQNMDVSEKYNIKSSNDKNFDFHQEYRQEYDLDKFNIASRADEMVEKTEALYQTEEKDIYKSIGR